MKRFEIQYSPNVFMIVSFERTIVAGVFLYEGKTYISKSRLAKTDDAKFQFNFQFTREKNDWNKVGEMEIDPLTESYAEVKSELTNILVTGIKGFEVKQQ